MCREEHHNECGCQGGRHQEHHGHHECDCDCHEGRDCECDCHTSECACECECHGSGHHSGIHFQRHFVTRAERIAELERYLQDLQNEAKAVEEQIVEMKSVSA